MNHERDKQWYSTKDLFEMMNEIKLELVETQIQMKQVQRPEEDTQRRDGSHKKTLTKLVNQTIDAVNDMYAAKELKTTDLQRRKRYNLIGDSSS